MERPERGEHSSIHTISFSRLLSPSLYDNGFLHDDLLEQAAPGRRRNSSPASPRVISVIDALQART